MKIKAREKWKLITAINNIKYNFNKSYFISNYGNVKSVDKSGNTILLKQRKTYESKTKKVKPYKRILFYYTKPTGEKWYINVEIHRLVAEYFIMTNSEQSELQVDHLDNNGGNNYYKNLEYVTSYENMQRALDRGRLGRGSKNKLAVLNDDQVHTICRRFENGEADHSVADSMNIPRTTVNAIRRGMNWCHISKQYKFEYTAGKRMKK